MRALLPFLRLFTTITVVLLATVQLGFAADFSASDRSEPHVIRTARPSGYGLEIICENEQLAGQVAMVLRKGRVVFRLLTAGRIRQRGSP